MEVKLTQRREFLSLVVAGAVVAVEELSAADEAIPFADAPKFNPAQPRLPWDETTQWMTPDEQVFLVAHYGYPMPIDAASWKLELGGLVEKPRTLTLDQLKSRAKKEYTYTLECSGNPAGGNGGLIGNAKWTGTPLASILKEADLKPEGTEVAFFALDQGTEKIGDADYKQNFSRSLSVKEAMREDLLLCWEMNGKPLAQNHGAPLRLVVPGWYGVAWVKWLNRIDVTDRAQLARFMGKDYVTLRAEKRGEETIWRQSSVGRMNVKSIPARVTRQAGGLQVLGAAWSDGAAIRTVDVKIDNGGWQPAKLISNGNHPYAWTFWTYDWKDAQPGEHAVSARATDAKGRTQPAPDDLMVTSKKTRWENYQQAVRKIKI